MKIAAFFKDGYPSAENDLHPVFRAEAQQSRLRPEHHRLDLRVPVFQSEIEVAGVMSAEVRYLAFHPHVPVFALKMRAHCGDQIADDPYTAIGRFEGKPKLINERHFDECTVRL